MTTTLSTERADGVTVSISIRDPEFGDEETIARRQAVGTTDGGVQFVEDLALEDGFWVFEFQNLTAAERSDLIRLIRAAGYRRRAIDIAVTGGHLPRGINTGQTVTSGINTGDGYNTGQTIYPDTARIPGVYLDQGSLALKQVRDELSNVTLRFRVPAGALIAGG